MKAFRSIGIVFALGLIAVFILSLPPRERVDRKLPAGFTKLRLSDEEEKEAGEDRKEEGHAWEAFEWWYGTRAYPFELLPKAAYFEAYRYSRENLVPAGSRDAAARVALDRTGQRRWTGALAGDRSVQPERRLVRLGERRPLEVDDGRRRRVGLDADRDRVSRPSP